VLLTSLGSIIGHLLIADILLAAQLFLLVLGFLFLLDQVAESTAAGGGNVGDAGSLEVVLVADVHSLHGFWHPVETEAHGGKEEKARGVDGLVALHVAVLAGSVVGFTKGDAWAAVGYQAGINGAAAAKEAVAPRLSTLWTLGVDSLSSIAQDLIEAVLPVIDIIIIDRTSGVMLNWSSSWGGSDLLIDWSRHCSQRGDY